MYRFQTFLLLAGLAGLLVLIGHWLFGPVVATILAGITFLVQWVAFDRSHDLVLWLHRAQPLPRWQGQVLHEMVDELASRAGIETPRLMVYPSQMPNAFALAGRRRRSVVAVSTALAQLMSAREMRGIVAHEIAHLRHRDSFVSLAAGIAVQTITFTSQAVLILLALLSFTGLVTGAVWPALLLLAAAPTGASLLQAGLMRTRERLADEAAAELTGDPHGLASALIRLQRYTLALSGWLRRFRFIYTSEGSEGGGWFRTHPPTNERVRALLGQHVSSPVAVEPVWRGSRPAWVSRLVA